MFCWEPCVITVYYHVLPGFSFWILWPRSSKLHPGTLCSFLVYLSIPNDQVLGNNWYLPDLAVFMYHSQMKLLQMEVNSLGALTLPKSAWSCWEPLFRKCLWEALSQFNLCIKTLSKQPSCCPPQRKAPLKGAVLIWIFPAQVRGETGQQDSTRHQELLSFKTTNCCQS